MGDRAAAELRPDGLVAGQAYARAAATLWPDNDEALETAQEVEKSRTSHASLGPAHPDTIACNELVAEILRKLNSNVQA